MILKHVYDSNFCKREAYMKKINIDELVPCIGDTNIIFIKDNYIGCEWIMYVITNSDKRYNIQIHILFENDRELWDKGDTSIMEQEPYESITIVHPYYLKAFLRGIYDKI